MTAPAAATPRIAYSDAGALAREAIGLACSLKLSQTEWRVFAAVLDRTITFSKQSDLTSSRQIVGIVYGTSDSDDDNEATTGWQRRNVTNSLKSLAAKGLIGYEATRGRNARCRITLMEGVSVDARSFPQGVSAEHERCVDRAQKVCQSAATPRSNTEKTSEAVDPVDDVLARVRATVRASEFGNKKLERVDDDRVRRIIRLHQTDTPVSLLAAAAIGEPCENLRHYKLREAGVA